MRRVLRTVVLSVAALGCASVAPPATSTAVTRAPLLVVVVRHGEKAPAPANDPVLSVAGMARAAALDSMLRPLLITDVVVSHLQRTRLTALAFITRTSPLVHVVPIGSAGVDAHVKAVVDTVLAISRRSGAGGVLVVGHSNTVTPIVEAISGKASPALCDSQYSQYFMLRERSVGVIEMARSTYGAADPADAACAGMK